VSTPIIGSEGLLRLAGLVERLRSRELDEGDTSWTARTQTPLEIVHADEDSGGGAVGAGAAGETAGGHPDVERVGGTDGGCAVPDEWRGRR
jgi:hypothetical protein